MSEFGKFNDAVDKQFKKMQKADELFVVDVPDKNYLWDVYLNGFAEGTNPMYKERTEHDCNCCKQFIRDVAGVVSIKNGKVSTIWDIDVGGVYQPVADALKAAVKELPIANVYRHWQKAVGTPLSRQSVDGGVIEWDHFNTVLPSKYVVSGSIGSATGDTKANYDVLKRSLEEISPEAVEIVEDLIIQDSIYRGAEHKGTVALLKKLQSNYAKAKNKNLFLWENAASLKHAGRIRNTVIGTLLTDISDGVELEKAVKSFEAKTAPENYKRTSALITQGMIKKAQEDVKKLGIEDSLYRRYAKESDLTINNVLFADRSTKSKMKGNDPFSDLQQNTVKDVKSFDKIQTIGINDFVENVLPTVKSMEVFVENKHAGNLVSLIAPVHDDAPNIMKWDNNFSWSYNGEVTDSIKERVKSAGGNVVADVRASLSWSNYDDLDLHVKTPNGEIYYCNSKVGNGHLDIDMNAGGRRSRTPVENVFWKDASGMTPGLHEVFVRQFSKREAKDVGFELQFEENGNVFEYSYPQPVTKDVKVLDFKYSKEKGVEIVKEYLPSTSTPRDFWNVDSQNFHKVKMVMGSPNHWDDQEVGNKHWFFMIDGCYNDEPARGFYNEFLRNDLNKHRKVFEVLGAKMKTDETQDQLSGLGFSSTKRDELVVKVTGSSTRTLKVKF